MRYCGFVCLDKDEGLTSFFAATLLKRIFGEKKAGHTGTLDPMATGVLPVALGNASRFIGFLPEERKIYDASFIIGRTTDTLDTTGKLLSETDAAVTLEDIARVLPVFSGDIMQVPPMFSALKQDGVRMYELARSGIVKELPARPVTVFDISAGITGRENEFTLHLECSAGTYVRSVIRDIGDALGTGAVMSSLRRTGAHALTQSDSYTLEKLRELKDEGALTVSVIPVEKMLSRYPSVTVSDKQAVRFANGGELDKGRTPCDVSDTLVRVFAPDGTFSGLGFASESEISVKRVFVRGDTDG